MKPNSIRRRIFFPKLNKPTPAPRPSALVHQRGYRIVLTSFAKLDDWFKRCHIFAYARITFQNVEIGVVGLNLVKNEIEFTRITSLQTQELYRCALQVIQRHHVYCNTKVEIGVCKIQDLQEAEAPAYTPYPHAPEESAPLFFHSASPFLFGYDSVNYALVPYYTPNPFYTPCQAIKSHRLVSCSKPRRSRMLFGMDVKNIIGPLGKRSLRCRRNMLWYSLLLIIVDYTQMIYPIASAVNLVGLVRWRASKTLGC